ncbi:uncharacterized protein STEHIDRAFT_137150 [Stereum hirsutum FP-91666 SS1]|uniref:uncharacterized protein n=1 Tax=Stereum hirsutum (strain FP-91666) TaxID=721885 RepID=UPI0004410563|nr:uncharacterized protein STEHIDRAFT_137150 [Stereum hirsutum FP-91666 SS1]EIM91453.1 hypothetical protein STEHIDRAFT_137150 [Stereum hirsutum FP-91666 SS1]
MLLNTNHTRHGVGCNPPGVDICVGDGVSDVSCRTDDFGTGGAASIPLEEESTSRKDVLTVYSYGSEEDHLPNHEISPSGSPCDSSRPSNSGPGRALSQRSPHNSEPPTPTRDNFSPPTFVDLTPSIDSPIGIVTAPAYLQQTSTNDVDEEVEVGVDVGLDLFANEEMDNEGDEYMS